MPKSEKLKRRSFLQNAIAGLASLMSLTFAGPAIAYLFSSSTGARIRQWADAGDIAGLIDVPQEVIFEVRQTDGWSTSNAKQSAWVVHDEDRGSFAAFSPSCTHLGCAYRWEAPRGEPTKGSFICPCHGSRFARNGDVLTGPAVRPLERYATRVQGTRLWISPSVESNES